MSRIHPLLIVRLAILLGGLFISALALLAGDSPNESPAAQPARIVPDDEVLKELRRLGAKVRIDKARGDESEGAVIVLGEDWQGTSDDLKLLKRVPNIERLEVLGVRITDDDLKQLDGLKHLTRVSLFGTKVTADGAARLAKAHPGVEIDRRGNVKLGIAIESTPAGLKITVVQDGSAADRAGLKAGEIIVTLDGKEVPDVDRLQKLIGAHDPGDKVTIELRRGDETLKNDITLGSWR